MLKLFNANKNRNARLASNESKTASLPFLINITNTSNRMTHNGSSGIESCWRPLLCPKITTGYLLFTNQDLKKKSKKQKSQSWFFAVKHMKLLMPTCGNNWELPRKMAFFLFQIYVPQEDRGLFFFFLTVLGYLEINWMESCIYPTPLPRVGCDTRSFLKLIDFNGISTSLELVCV